MQVDVDCCRTLALGPSELAAERRSHEWRLRHREVPTAAEDRCTLSEGTAPDEGDGWSTVKRIGGSSHADGLAVLPRTADRPIVSLPADPFVVPQSTTVTLFVSTPLWLDVRIDGETALEVPTLRPRDIWIGPTTGPGEAGYANRTQCRQQLDEIPVRPHRVLTPVVVHNRSREPRALERLMLAVPYLAVFATGTNRLWTERIELTIRTDESESRIVPGAPEDAVDGRVVAAARETAPAGGLGRLLADVF